MSSIGMSFEIFIAFLKASTPDSEDHLTMQSSLLCGWRSSGYRMLSPDGMSGQRLMFLFPGRTATMTGSKIKERPRDVWNHPRRLTRSMLPQRSDDAQKSQVWVDILNYVDYVKKDAIHILRTNWVRYYGGKTLRIHPAPFLPGIHPPEKIWIRQATWASLKPDLLWRNNS